MFTNDLNVAGSNLADSLNELMNKNVQKMQQREQLKQMLFGGQQGQSQSLNASNFLQQQNPQNLIERSAGKTPLQFPSISPQQMQQPQLPMAQEPMQEIKKTAGEKTQEAKEKIARQARIDKETFPYYKKLKDQNATTSEVDARLDEMEDLLGTGNVQGGTFIRSMEALSQIPYVGKLAGAIEQALLTNESQVFKKLSTDFLRDAKPYFGNNLSTREVELFLERVPSLMLSNEGNRAVIRNFRALNDYIKAQDKIMEGVIAENGGERPRHLESKVQARMKNSADNLRRAFRDSAKMIPQKQVRESFTKRAYEKKKAKLP
jgi:hypothetical protein